MKLFFQENRQANQQMNNAQSIKPALYTSLAVIGFFEFVCIPLRNWIMIQQVKASLNSLDLTNTLLVDNKAEDSDVGFSKKVYDGCLDEVKDALQMNPRLANTKITINGFSGPPLQLAAIRGHKSIVSLLVSEFSLSIHRRHKGNKSILLNAAESIHNEKLLCQKPSLFRRFFPVKKQSIFEFLVHMGADIDDTDNDGNTALMLACLLGHEHIAKELIKLGANPMATNWNGVTAFDVAMKDAKLAEVFRSHFCSESDEPEPVTNDNTVQWSG